MFFIILISFLCQYEFIVSLEYHELCSCHPNTINSTELLEIKAQNEWFRSCNITISQNLLRTKPIVKYPGKRLLYHDLTTLVLFRPFDTSHPAGF